MLFIAKTSAAFERFKPILIDQIMVQMGWPLIGLRPNLKDLVVICFGLCFAHLNILG